MKPFLALSVAWMAAGCSSSHSTHPCGVRTVSLGWPSFLLSTGTVVTTCKDAGIGTVVVFLDDQSDGSPVRTDPLATVPCTDGGVDTGVGDDSEHRFRVEGLDATTGAVALRDQVTVMPADPAAHPGGVGLCSFVNTQPSEGTLEIGFYFNDPYNPGVLGQCASDTDSFMWFTIHDEVASQDISVDSAHTPTRYPCSSGHPGDVTPLPISFPVASGDYMFGQMKEVAIPGNALQAGNCGQTTLAPTSTHDGRFVVTGATTHLLGVGLNPPTITIGGVVYENMCLGGLF